MTDHHDLTGRDLDQALCRALRTGSDYFGCGYDRDPARIPEMFAEIAARSGVVELVRLSSGQFVAICREKVTEADFNAEGFTPNEALARLLLMVVER